MSNQEYVNKLIGGIGRISLAANVGNAFPLVGETVSLEATTKWAQKMYFTKRSTSDTAVMTGETIDNTSQKTSVTIPVSGSGDLRQEVRAVNYRNAEELFSASLVRYLYAMQPQTLPYHEVWVSSEISRTDQSFDLFISGDNGYDTSRERIVQVYVLKENGSIDNPDDVVSVRAASDYTNDNGELVFSQYSIPTRGIYDVETRYYDTLTQKTISKRINKLITITPRLAALPVDGQEPIGTIESGTKDVNIKMYETGTHDLYMVFDIPNMEYYPEINMGNVPEGYDAYTLVLKKPFAEDDNVISRVRLNCNVIKGNPKQSPTPQFNEEHPLVITINQETPLELHGQSYNTLAISGIRDIVVDGRGYHNLERGLRFSANPVTKKKPTIPVQYSNGSSDMELFSLDITGSSFTAIMAKTDPDGTNPWWWYGNFDQKNFRMHHLYIHDTDCEGCYLGYYTPGQEKVTYTGETVTFENLKGEMVTYTKGQSYMKKAHYLTNFRFYRNLFERTGYDGVQISNAIGEVCYNTLRGCAYREESSQTSGLSIQSFSGKCYNNFLLDSHGPNMQVGPLGGIEIFNNIVQSRYGNGIQFLFNYDTPEQNPTGAAEGSGVINNDIQIVFRNNVISTPGMTANGRNTVQIRGVHMYDNIIVNNGTLFGNMTSETLAVWKSQAINDEIFLYSDLYQKSIDLKIADYISGDYRIAFDSSLVTAGLGTGFTFDYRGYLNWYNSVYPIGAFMGKFIDSSVIDSGIRLRGITLALSTGIEHEVSVSFDYIGTPTHYRLGESEDLSSAIWLEWTEDVTYTFASSGNKTLYAQIRNAENEVSEVQCNSINVPDLSDKIVISTGWTGYLLGNKTSIYDEVNHLTKVATTTKDVVCSLFTVMGTPAGSLIKIDGEGASYMAESTKGASTGDNSGIYPDEILERNVCTASGSEKYRENKIEGIAPGNYKVRIFCSTIHSSVNVSKSTWKLSVDGTETEFTKPEGFTPKDNLTTWLEQTITIGENGFSILWGVNSSTSYIFVPLNIIEIEKL
ncbi:hypothetical protein [Bacteroides cellulosilyticus]|uniref:hypothetical protein n=1 Tax=Bacteroides cellulosilyticus TaxID=246787 RepID=UPI0032C09641